MGKKDDPPTSLVLSLGTSGGGGGALGGAGEASGALVERHTEAAALVRRVADSFAFNERARETIVAGQLAHFRESLCSQLRMRIAELDARAKQLDSALVAQRPGQAAGGKDALVSTVSALASAPFSLLSGQNAGSTVLALIFFMQSAGPMLAMNTAHMGPQLLLAVGAIAAGRRRWDQWQVDSTRDRCRNVVSQFSGGSPTLTEASSLELERNVWEVTDAIAFRHIEQIVALTKQSQTALAGVVVSRIIRHLKRSPQGFTDESRSPIVAEWQRFKRRISEVYQRIALPQDRIPEPKPLTLVERCIRALSSEKDPVDDVALEFEQWFSVELTRRALTRRWTASGVLSSTGLRVRLPGSNKDAYYAHEFSLVQVYGFAYGTESECRERKMRMVNSPDAETPGGAETTGNVRLNSKL